MNYSHFRMFSEGYLEGRWGSVVVRSYLMCPEAYKEFANECSLFHCLEVVKPPRLEDVESQVPKVRKCNTSQQHGCSV